KQAIYGWRGGVPELFEVVSQSCAGLEEPSLTRSRRSSQPVIDAVNRVFERLDGNPALADLADASTVWQKGYETHTTAKTELAGHVRMVTSPAAEVAAEQRETTLGFAADEIARLVREAPGRSVGVLVRTNDAIVTLIQELAGRKVTASEEGGNPLTDSPAVAVVLSLLAIADHPGDTAARFHVAHSPLGPVLGLSDYADDRQAERLSLAVRQQLLVRGYGPTLYRWARELAEHCGPRDASRLEQLVELAYRFDPDAGLRTRDFAALVQRERVEAPSPADVRVMTIHKAKGLEFDIVVLPQLDYKLRGQTPPVLVGRAAPAAAVNLVCKYPNEALRSLLPTEIGAAYDAYQQRVVRESLCLLYVALTRAVHALHIIVPPAKKPYATLAGVLHGALVGPGALEPEKVVYEQGDQAWYREPVPDVAGVRKQDVAENWPQQARFEVDLAAGKRRRRGLERESPSELARAAHVDLATRMLLESAQAVNRGSVFHAWFEQIEWLDGAELDDAALRQIALKIGAAAPDLDQWLPQFRAKLLNPRLRGVLSRALYRSPDLAPWSQRPEICADLEGNEPTIEVYRERPFAVRLGDRLLSGTFDRLVLVRCAARDVASARRSGASSKTAVKERTVVRQAATGVVAAEVLDFKTDAIAAGDSHAVEQIVARYR
ncbi:MAG TPA: 3'-5' exonuclease, partial [Pirellulales bacterium]|nr:3'-5' exonuclease [Pirellulales bacterium]